MNFEELSRTVAALAGEDLSTRRESLISAINRAARCAYSELSVVGNLRCFIRRTTPTERIGRLDFPGEGEIALSLSGRSYTMRLYGKGSYIHEEGGIRRRVDFSASGERFSGLVPSGEAKLIFLGDDPFSVTELVCFSESYERLEDVPDGAARKRIDLRRAVPDFLAFIGEPRDSDGNIISGAELSGGTVTMPDGFSGEVLLDYRRMPATVTGEEREIPFPEELVLPIATLAASYLIRETCPELADSLKEIYDSDAAVIKAAYRSETPRRVVTNGWA